jgi:hypothetical protein
MFFSRRRGCGEPGANAASVPMLISRGFAVFAEGVRLAGGDPPAAVFVAAVFLAAAEGRLVRTGRSLMAGTSLIIG